MLTINDKEILVKGAVLAVLADTQAAHSIGGFKVGVGFALRQCRNCLATRDSTNVKVTYLVLYLATWSNAVNTICSSL